MEKLHPCLFDVSADPVEGGWASESAVVRRAIALTRSGNAEALEFLYVRFAADVARAAGSDDRVDSESGPVLREVFSRLPLMLAAHESGRESFGSWLSGVAATIATEQRQVQAAAAAQLR